MKNANSLLRRVLALALACMLLAGCSSKQQPGSSEAASSGDSHSSSTESSAPDSSADVSGPDSSSGGNSSQSNSSSGKTTAGKGSTSRQTNSTGTASTTKSPSNPGSNTSSSALKQSAYVKNSSVWKTKMLSSGKFFFELEMTSIGTMNKQLLKNSISKQKVGEYQSILPSVKAAEWGYSVLNLPTGSQDGAGRVINNTYLDNPPANRAEAVSTIKDFLMAQYVRGEKHPWYSMNGHHSWHHYAGEFGFDVLASEIGENIHGYQLHLAMNRGAARQYGKPWAIDFSSWHGAGILDYSTTPICPGYSGVNNGHSLSLVERSFVASYMSGASAVVAEAGAAIAFYTQIENGMYKLSPYGEVCKNFNAFTQAYSDVGITYTPIAIALDYYHGMDRQPSGSKAFGKFAYNSGDMMSHNLIDMIWPGTWSVESRGNETGALTNGPYGDSFDFLLQNASQAVLNSYPAIVLSGDVTLTAAEVSRYKAYVKQGGILVLNTAYRDQFPEYKGTLKNNRLDIADGKGKVIMYGPDYSVQALGGIFKELLQKFMPFSFSTNIEHIVNVKDGYMYVTLINSDGVTKTSHGTPIVDNSKTKTVTTSYTGSLAIASVKEIYGGRNVAVNSGKVSVTLKPGEIAILEYRFK